MSCFRRPGLAEPTGARPYEPIAARDVARLGGATVIGICASTGGPHTLETVLGRLAPDFPVPVLIVQHMLFGFTEGMVSWLDGQVAPPARLARDGQDLGPGIWFAGDGCHLVLDACHRLRLDPRPPIHGHRPSGDLLLGSLAEVAGAGATAVVLTGMGRDGAAGLAAVAASGGHTIAQDQASSVVYGMPRAAAELGAGRVLPPAAIGDALARLGTGRRR
jgi:two-component system chemotaxis response regulator CheB